MAAVQVCDAKCQKQKRLDELNTVAKSGPTPEAREQARLQYHTLKDGQGWLRSEKEKIARQELLPVIQNLESKYASLQSQLAQKNAALQRQTVAQSTEVGDEAEARYIQSQLDEASALNRTFELGQPPATVQELYSWIPTLLDGLIALLGLVVVYLVFVAKKLNRFMPLVKWILAIPLVIVGLVYALLALITTFVAWIITWSTGTYPRWALDIVLGTIKFWNRVYGYAVVLVTDEYPSFSL